MAEKIFITCRREDSEGYARALFQKISEFFDRRQIFMDVDTVEPGIDFVDAIEHAVGSCKILISLIGESWLSERLQNSTDCVRVEIETALARNIRIVPVFVNGGHMPEASALPDDLRSLSRRQGVSVTHENFEADLVRLIIVIEKAVKLNRSENKQSEAPMLVNSDRKAKAMHTWIAAIMGFSFLVVPFLIGYPQGKVEFGHLAIVAWGVGGFVTLLI